MNKIWHYPSPVYGWSSYEGQTKEEALKEIKKAIKRIAKTLTLDDLSDEAEW